MTLPREGEKILTSIASKPQATPAEGTTPEPPQPERPVMEAESMNQCLMQVLQTYARDRFGTEFSVKFIPAGE